MKLATDKLLEIKSDEVFRELSVPELQNLLKTVQHEIEKKREELRSTVGERYRDLLKAADTITNMRETAESVVTCVHDVTSLCQTLQEKHLIGLKLPDDTEFTHSRTWLSEEISAVIETKVLLTIPEQIWTSLDNKKFALAAELYLFAEHTHLGLEVSQAVKRYPIVIRQWNTVSSCRQVVINSARQELKNATLQQLDCADCLATFLLLEPIKLEDILKDYLELRKFAFEHYLKSDDNPTVKEKLHASVLSVKNTLLLTCVCFSSYDGKMGLLEKKIAEVTDEGATPTFSKISYVSCLADQHLSPVIKTFRPSTSKPIVSFSAEFVRSELSQWLTNVQSCLEAEMGNLLGVVGNLQGLVLVRERVSSVPNPPGWNDVERIFGPYNVYKSLLEPHVSNRALQLVSNVWREAINAVLIALTEVDEKLKDEKESQSECNLRWFIWKESGCDEVALQTCGCTPRVAHMCKALDQYLKLLIDDVSTFIADNVDQTSLLDFLNSSSFESMHGLIKSMQEDIAVKALKESSIIVRARFLLAVTSQCPHLKKCLRQGDIPLNGNSRTWSEMVALLCEASTELWRSWKLSVTSKFEALVHEKLDPNVLVSSFLLSKPACEVVAITEEAEDNTSVTSQLRVPSQPSFNLQETLHQICLRLNAVAVHTLPRVIHLEVIEIIANLILNHYNKLSVSDTIYQSHAWQLLLDIRFLTLLLLPRDNQALSKEICSRLENLIDPFDLNVCYPYLQANVKKSAIRLQGTFGVLIDHSEKSAVLNSLKVAVAPKTSSAHEDPNVLAISTNVPWFPLLPISSGGPRKKEDSPSKQNKHRGKESKKESTSTDFVKTAGAFFGAMTGGWS